MVLWAMLPGQWDIPGYLSLCLLRLLGGESAMFHLVRGYAASSALCLVCAFLLVKALLKLLPLVWVHRA